MKSLYRDVPLIKDIERKPQYPQYQYEQLRKSELCKEESLRVVRRHTKMVLHRYEGRGI